MPVKITLSKYDKGIDYAAIPRGFTYSGARSKKHKFITRYIDGSLHQKKPTWKSTSVAEMNAIYDSNMGFIPVFERSVTRPFPGSVSLATQNGIADGILAKNDLAFLGYPSDGPVICAAGDTDITNLNINQAVAYYKGFDSQVANPCGIYGDFDLIDAVKNICPILWQANAAGWSYSKIHPQAHVLQLRLYLGYDPNIVLRSFDIYAGSSENIGSDAALFNNGVYDPKSATPAYGNLPFNPFLPDIKLGSKGTMVGYLQLTLKRFVDPTLNVTGTFDTKTRNAVINFQKNYSFLSWDGMPGKSNFMTPTGVVDRRTWFTLQNLVMNM